MKVSLEAKVRCKVTGFTGTVTGRSEFTNGCVRCQVTAKSVKNASPVVEWIDEQDIVVLSEPRASKPDLSGGPRPDAVRRGDARR